MLCQFNPLFRRNHGVVFTNMKTIYCRRVSLLQSGTTICLALSVGVLLVSGCSKKPPVAATQTALAVADTTAMPVVENRPIPTPPVAPAAVIAGPDGGADLKQLNHAYIGWIVQNHRRPKTFEEFISASGMKVPPAPAGKKYVIEQSGFINLVNQ